MTLQSKVRRSPLIIKVRQDHAAAVAEKVLFYGGLAAVAFGAHLIYAPLGFITAGLCGVWLGLNIAVERDHQ